MANDHINLLSTDGPVSTEKWQYVPTFTPIIGQEDCGFAPNVFLSVLLNILKNPNITSSHLFRADILYDTDGTLVENDSQIPGEASQPAFGASDAWLPEMRAGYRKTRTLIRRLVPRNPQLDKPLEQTCHVFEHHNEDDAVQTIAVQCIPHVKTAAEMPWYHPCVKALLYMYSWSEGPKSNESDFSATGKGQGLGRLSVHYQLFSETDLPLSKRLERTAFHLLTTAYKHGQGRLQGYTKKFHHDLLVSQSRVQDTYSALKLRHAKRLCDNWVESTEPSKHVFEDLAIAAFLVEFWREMYKDPSTIDNSLPKPPNGNSELPEFPGFVDIGCGNGVLTEVLLCCGYSGWGFDARKRKTWSVLSSETKKRLEEKILVPQPLLSEEPVLLPDRNTIPKQDGDSSVLSYFGTAMSSVFTASPPQPESVMNDQNKWHNGLFPRGTFIVSNHADELTAWTPLLASLSSSPFLAIPCCSHNLAGTRFRAPSLYTNFTADAAAPNYFAKEKQKVGKAKHIAIHIPLSDEAEAADAINPANKQHVPETGDLKQLSTANRAKQPSAYSSLCDWVAALADEVDFDVEKENLRIPSTRNMAIIGRRRQDGSTLAALSIDGGTTTSRDISPDAWERVMAILAREKPESQAWVERARKLMAGKDDARVNHG